MVYSPHFEDDFDCFVGYHCVDVCAEGRSSGSVAGRCASGGVAHDGVFRGDVLVGLCVEQTDGR